MDRGGTSPADSRSLIFSTRLLPSGAPADSHETLGALVDDAESLAHAAARDVRDGAGLGLALDLAREHCSQWPRPGHGATAALWSALATVAASDLQVARAVEPHLDALAILHERGGDAVPPDSTWGVYAAEAPGARLEAARTGDAWRLSGVKPWCSLGGDVTHALVTAWDGVERRLFSVDMRQSTVAPTEQAWVARGLRDVRSTPVVFDGARCEPVGEPGWYLRRDGFAWGGMGVAAVWYGGAVAVARRLADQARERELDQIGHLHLGHVDVLLHAARCVLVDAAAAVDSGAATGERGALLAHRVRSVVALAAEEVLSRADHAMGPGPLVAEDDHAGRVADLHLYLRQHHAERDEAALGRTLATTGRDS